MPFLEKNNTITDFDFLRVAPLEVTGNVALKHRVKLASSNFRNSYNNTLKFMGT